MPHTTMQLGDVIQGEPSVASVRVQAELLAATNPNDPRIVQIERLAAAVRSHNANAAIARELWGQIEGREGQEGYEYVRATLQELNDRLAVARGLLIKPFSDYKALVEEAHRKGYLTDEELAQEGSIVPGGLGAFTLIIIATLVVLGSLAGFALHRYLPDRTAEAVARADSTRKVAQEAVAVLLNPASSPSQQQTASDLLKSITSQPGGPLAPAAAGFGVGAVVAAGLTLFLITRRQRRSAHGSYS